VTRRYWLLSAVAIALLIGAARRFDWHGAVLIARAASSAPLATAAILNLLSLQLRGVRWWIFLRAAGVRSLTLALRGTIVGAGVNNVLLANSGDAARVLLVARSSGASRTAVTATLALERLLDPICLALLVFCATFVIPIPAAYAAMRSLGGLVLLVVAALALVVLSRTRRVSDVGDRTAGWRGQLRELRVHICALATTSRLGAALAISLGEWSLQVATFALVARATGLGLPLGGTLAALIVTNAGLLIHATPGNLGLFQFAYEIAAHHFGVAANAAIATALLLQLVQIVPVTLAALVLAPGLFGPRRRTALETAMA